MSDGTGGTVNWSGNDLGVALARIEESTATFYMIAYRKAADDPATVDVRVRVTRPRVRVVSAPTRLTPPPDYREMNAMQRSIQVAEYLNDDIERREIAFDTQVVAFPGNAETSRLAMFLEVSGLELDRLAQLRGDDQVQLEVGGFALADDGVILDSFRQRVTIDVGKMRERGSMATQSFRFSEYVDTPPGQHRLRLLLRESEIGQLSSRTQRYYSPGPVERLTVARPMVLSGLEATVHDDGGFDPLSLGGVRQLPVASPTLVPGRLFTLLVVVYRLPRDPQTGEFLAGLMLEAEDVEGDPYRLRDFTILGSAVDEASDATQLLVEARLPGHMRPGSGRLWARLVDRRPAIVSRSRLPSS